LSYVINGPAIEAGEAEKGWTARELFWADFGFDMASNGFVVSERLLDERPDVVRRFLRATYRGVSWALSHPVEAADLFSERNPRIDQGLARLQWKRTIPFIVTDDSRRDGLGFLPGEKLEETLRALGRGGAESAEAVHSNDFLPDKDIRLPPQSAGAPSETS
jgi:NitT/TauT family transport system substrate-binding protein